MNSIFRFSFFPEFSFSISFCSLANAAILDTCFFTFFSPIRVSSFSYGSPKSSVSSSSSPMGTKSSASSDRSEISSVSSTDCGVHSAFSDGAPVATASSSIFDTTSFRLLLPRFLTCFSSDMDIFIRSHAVWIPARFRQLYALTLSSISSSWISFQIAYLFAFISRIRILSSSSFSLQTQPYNLSTPYIITFLIKSTSVLVVLFISVLNLTVPSFLSWSVSVFPLAGSLTVIACIPGPDTELRTSMI